MTRNNEQVFLYCSNEIWGPILLYNSHTNVHNYKLPRVHYVRTLVLSYSLLFYSHTNKLSSVNLF